MSKTIGLTYGSGRPYEDLVGAAIEREKKNCFFDEYRGLTEKNIPPQYISQNQTIWEHFYDRFRGLIWKPHIVNDILNNLNYGDFLFYHDADCLVHHSIAPLKSQCSENGGLLTLSTGCQEKAYTKKKCLELLDCNHESFFNEQWMAGLFLLQKNNLTVDFISEWCASCQNFNLISNEPPLDEYPEFIDHRHDQSIFSLLLKKRGYTSPESLHNNNIKMQTLTQLLKIEANEESLLNTST